MLDISVYAYTIRRDEDATGATTYYCTIDYLGISVTKDANTEDKAIELAEKAWSEEWESF